MRCSGCGKEIPFSGKVCPYCHRDKSADQQVHAVVIGITVVCMGLGYLFGGFLGMLIGGGIGVVIAVGVTVSSSGKAEAASQPQQVRLAPESTASPVAPHQQPKTTQQRLAELEMLRKEGLITEDEFAAKRQAVLDSL